LVVGQDIAVEVEDNPIADQAEAEDMLARMAGEEVTYGCPDTET
jgi:hypothetical protein